MSPSRSRTLYLIAFLFLAALSLRKKSVIVDWIEAAFEPARAARALAAPLTWLSIGRVRAAEAALLAGEEARRASARSVLEAAQTSATPSERSLSLGRGLVHAEVVERVEGDPDRVIVRFPPDSKVEPGMPVVCGDYYVGRVSAVQGCGRGEGTVDLVTRREFRVGGVVQGSSPRDADPIGPETRREPPRLVPPLPVPPLLVPPLLVVGGLVPRGVEKGDRLLATHCPSDASVAAGEVRVREFDASAGDRFCGLADGFLLGSLERVRRGGADVLAVRPGLDYESAISQIGILCPAQIAPAGPDLARDPFKDERWLDASFALAGDTSFWREGRVLLAGSAQGVLAGAALADGASFLGAVDTAGTSTAKVSLLGDPGLELTALASVLASMPANLADSKDPPTDRTATSPIAPIPPMPIGRLVSLGRDRADGSVLLRWSPTVPIAPSLPDGVAGAGEPLSVVLYTASGHRSVPPGLRVGRTVLPRGRGPFVLRVRQEETGLALTHVRVWREAPDSAQTAMKPMAGRGERRP